MYFVRNMTAFFQRVIYVLLFVALTSANHMAFAKDKEIVIGSKAFTEQYILSEIARQLLEQNGFNVTVVSNLSTITLRGALENNEVDLYYEYTGTAYSVLYGQPTSELSYDSDQLYEWVKQADAEKNLIWLEPLPFNNTYAFITTKNIAKKYNIYTISELSQFMKTAEEPLTLGVFAESWERPDTMKQVEKVYNLEFPLSYVRKMDQGLIYLALQQEYVDIGVGQTTDGFIVAFELVVLEDDKRAFPVYNPAPVVRKSVLEEYPETAAILNQLTQYLDTETIRRLNAEVVSKHRSFEIVVREWLRENQLDNIHSGNKTSRS